MRYECEDIRRVLSDERETAADMKSFEAHLESCPRCRELCDLGADLERELRLTLADDAGRGFESSLKAKVAAIASEFSASRSIEGATPFALTAAILVFAALIRGRWSLIEGIIPRLKPEAIRGEIAGLFNQIGFPRLEIFGLDIHAGASPLIIFGLVSAAAVIWIFSLLEFEKNLK